MNIEILFTIAGIAGIGIVAAYKINKNFSDSINKSQIIPAIGDKINSSDVQDALEALDALDGYARMDAGVDAFGPRGVLERFIVKVEQQLLNEQQLK